MPTVERFILVKSGFRIFHVKIGKIKLDQKQQKEIMMSTVVVFFKGFVLEHNGLEVSLHLSLIFYLFELFWYWYSWSL